MINDENICKTYIHIAIYMQLKYFTSSFTHGDVTSISILHGKWSTSDTVEVLLKFDKGVNVAP